jgi:hypothetical protein
MTPSIESQYPIRDGFLLRTDLRCEPTYLALALEQFEPLRRARSYRARYWMTPESTKSFQVPASDSYEQEVTCVPGSVIWGFIWHCDAQQGSLSFQVREACTDVPLLSEVIRTDAFATGAQDGSALVYSQNLLPRLLVIPSPGLLVVEIANLTAVPQKAQVVLCGGEPVPIC